MIKILKKGEYALDDVLIRDRSGRDVSQVVSDIIFGVKMGGDPTLINYCKTLDGADIKTLELTKEEIDAAVAEVPEDVMKTLQEAADRIAYYHKAQVKEGYTLEEEGLKLRQKILPLKRVGIYIPGGTAAYPSTVLMNAIPAKIAGVEEIVMVSPPTTNGSIAPVILAAAKIAGVDRVFRIGGAQAVAALAYGTKSVPMVDKIVGPGNAYVAEAKKQVFGQVGIDLIAGPSEVLVIADKGSDARIIAADMLSQAEHDRMATAVLITNDQFVAERTAEQLEVQLSALPRQEIARESIEVNGKIIIVKTIDEAVDLANKLAPEHLELFLDDAEEWADKVENAGSVFVGKNCPEALGDYFAGPNHTLPTSGTARFASPLTVNDFTKSMSLTYYGRDALEYAKDKVALLAREEGLEGHAISILSRFDE
ncbi:MAG: histidinol dehydrogenase [Clostridiales bacterium]|nr:histidinol dehydrogenase [Clostridiales bacterium]